MRWSVGGGLARCRGDGGRCAQVWGENKHGQLGDGTTTVRKAPVGVSGLTGLMPTGA